MWFAYIASNNCILQCAIDIRCQHNDRMLPVCIHLMGPSPWHIAAAAAAAAAGPRTRRRRRPGVRHMLRHPSNDLALAPPQLRLEFPFGGSGGGGAIPCCGTVVVAVRFAHWTSEESTRTHSSTAQRTFVRGSKHLDILLACQVLGPASIRRRLGPVVAYTHRHICRSSLALLPQPVMRTRGGEECSDHPGALPRVTDATV